MYTVVLRGSNTSTYPLCESSLWERWFIHLPDLSYLCILACIMLFDLTLSPHIAPSLYSMYKLLCYLTLEVPCAPAKEAEALHQLFNPLINYT